LLCVVANLGNPLLDPRLGDGLDGVVECIPDLKRKRDGALATIRVARPRHCQMRENQHWIDSTTAEAVAEVIPERRERLANAR